MEKNDRADHPPPYVDRANPSVGYGISSDTVPMIVGKILVNALRLAATSELISKISRIVDFQLDFCGGIRL